MQAKGINYSRDVGIFNVVPRILVKIRLLDKGVFLLKQVAFQHGFAFQILCHIARWYAVFVSPKVGLYIDDMLQDGFEMDATMCSCWVSGCCEDGDKEMAMLIFYESINRNHVINVQKFSAFVKMMCEKRKVF